MRRRHLPVLAALAAFATSSESRAQQPAWPSRTIRIIVTFPPGGSSDIVARVLAEVLSQRLPQRVIVENRPGAGGTLGAAYVASQPADGYTLMLSNTAPIVTSPPIYANVPYDPVTGFSHIAYIGATPLVIVVNPRLVPATDLAGLVAWIKAQPAPPGFGSSGAGSVAHIFGEAFTARTGAQLTHVPYRGSAPMQADLLGGAIPLSFDTLPQNVENICAGRLRAIAITAPARQEMAPEVPTTAEAGFPGLEAYTWHMVMAPKGTPANVVQTVNQAFMRVAAEAAVQQRLSDLAMRLVTDSTPESAAAWLRDETQKWSSVVREANITVN